MVHDGIREFVKQLLAGGARGVLFSVEEMDSAGHCALRNRCLLFSLIGSGGCAER